MLRDAWLSRQAKSCKLSTVVATAVPVPVIPNTHRFISLITGNRKMAGTRFDSG